MKTIQKYRCRYRRTKGHGLLVVTALVMIANESAAQTPQRAPTPPIGFGQVQQLNPIDISTNGTSEIVFDYDVHGAPLLSQGDTTFFPDLPARAFVDNNGVVNLIISQSGKDQCAGLNQPTNGGNLRLTGTDFNSLTLDPGPQNDYYILQSNNDGQRCNYSDAEWLASTYYDQASGLVHGLVHMEYEAWTHSGIVGSGSCDWCDDLSADCCNGVVPPGSSSFCENIWQQITNCQITCVTHAISFDGGQSYVQRDDVSGQRYPDLLGHGPHVFDTTQGSLKYPTSGYTVPSNIFRHPGDPDGYYIIVKQQLTTKFAADTQLAWSWDTNVAGGAPAFHAILMRTDDLTKPENWRAWNGQVDGIGDPIFGADLPDPYRDGELVTGAANALDYVGYPLDDDWNVNLPNNINIGIASSSVTWNTYLNRFVVFDFGVNFADPTNYVVYFSLSEDLINWTPIKQVAGVELQIPVAGNPPIYPSLIDHNQGPNFETSDRNAYLYYSASDGNGKSDLRRIKLRFDKPTGWQ